MPFCVRVFVLSLIILTVLTDPAITEETVDRTWLIEPPALLPGPPGSFDEVAVKDPSIVFAEGAWHLFYTARSRDEYSTGYVSAPTLDGLQSATRYKLDLVTGQHRYACAPQVLYFEPQGRWYLIFQTREANYQPAFSTTKTISDPTSWSAPAHLIKKDTSAKWIDFWVICDELKAYLFYTQAHNSVMVRSTNLNDFPHGWGPSHEVLTDIHEAVHLYKVQGRDQYHMIYELKDGLTRSFGLAAAETLTGPWTKVTDRYATGNQLQFAGDTTLWTDMVSHGEIIRTGYNQKLEYDPNNCRWLIQGTLEKNLKGLRYEAFPWKLGIIKLDKR